MPSRDLKSGIPQETETPAPVSTIMFCAPTNTVINNMYDYSLDFNALLPRNNRTTSSNVLT